ncbi:hypothetical protein [Rhodovulum marinum]|uniref:Uncharacterized protein n=1 Tax=Rhodovulum marinum TaxID=320662 RepID=A0A4R2Q3F3_9RHOB|nr:hypothetical protein [Rhodovulum marinum]TCP43273.1 hypothetical protein EV662_102471 [Rhodovulum marinum]
MPARYLILGAVLSLMAAWPGPGAMARGCDPDCQKELREKVLRDLKAFNAGARRA